MSPPDWMLWLFARARYSMASGGSKSSNRSPLQAVLQERIDAFARLPKAPIVALLKVRTARAGRCGAYAPNRAGQFNLTDACVPSGGGAAAAS